MVMEGEVEVEVVVVVLVLIPVVVVAVAGAVVAEPHPLSQKSLMSMMLGFLIPI